MHDIAKNIESVRRRIAAAAESVGRAPDEVALLAVSKRIDPERIEAALRCGIEALGENRVQEAEARIPLISGSPEWHFIGPLQSNKAKRAGALFDAIHSVDRESLIPRLAMAPRTKERSVRVYIQVAAAALAEPAAALEVTRALCRQTESTSELELAGLMAMAPYDPDPEAARPTFRGLRWLRDRIQDEGDFRSPLGLSMGMTGDFEVAIQEGATIVRVGTAIFGPRPAR
jgi:pyridoxal phosphate enzyme (YggS family)